MAKHVLKKSFKRLLLVFLTIILMLCLFSCSKEDRSKASKIILITLDTTRADHLGCYDYDNIETPNLDYFATEGILFEKATCQIPITLPSHATMLTGVSPPVHGVRDNGNFILREENLTLAEILKQKGFKTGAAVSSFAVAKRWGISQGFDDYDDHFEWQQGKTGVKAERRADKTIDIAIKWLKSNAQKKFFYWIHLYDPHTDYEPPPPFDKIYQDSLYDGEIAFMDQEIGRLWNFLKENGLWEDSLILIIGDHGESLGEHGESTHETLIYESSMWIPFLIRGKTLKSGIKIEEIVSTLEVMPTTLDYLNMSVPNYCEGVSLLEVIDHNSDKLNGREIYLESLSAEILYGWSALKGIRRGFWKYIKAPKPELYNLDDDPNELDNVYKEYPDIVVDLQDALSHIEKRFSLVASLESGQEWLDDESREKLLSLGYIAGGFDTKGLRGKKDPKDMMFLEPLIKEAFSSLEKGDFKAADKAFTKVLTNDPENKAALILSTNALFQLNQKDKAIERLKKLLEIYPDESEGYRRLAKIYADLGRIKDSERILIDAINQFPEKIEFSFNLGMLYFDMSRIKDSMHKFFEVVEKNPGNAKAYFMLAKCQSRIGLEEKAIDSIQMAIKYGLGDQDDIFKDPDISRLDLNGVFINSDTE